jgi:pyruvate formate lyase activating enzyme
MENLQYLADLQLQSRVTLRLPLIPNYNTPSDRQRSRQQLEEMGFTHFDEFEYIIPE